MSQYPLKFCSFCRRDVQRRDDAPNCFHCDTPFKFGTDAEEKLSDIEEKFYNAEWQSTPLSRFSVGFIEISVCPVCHAVVLDKYEHKRWHIEELGK